MDAPKDFFRDLGSPYKIGLKISTRKKIFKWVALIFMLMYSLLTLFPFYVLFIRTFVGTKDSGDLHLLPPPESPISLSSPIGNLAAFKGLDLKQVKEDLGIKGYINPYDTLEQIGERFNITPADLKVYFSKFGRYAGWSTLLSGSKFWAALTRSILITIISLIGLTILSILTGYGLGGLRRRDQVLIYNIYLLEMIIPPMLVILPQFLLVQGIQKWIPGSDQLGSPSRVVTQIITLILIYIKGGAFSTMVFTSAINSIPREMEESAQMDGASRWQYLYHILLPLLQVPIATLVVIMLPDLWNRFLEPYIYLDPSNTVVLPLIQTFAGRYSTNYQVIFSGVFISILPLLIVYLIFRRLFIQGVMSGAVKG